MVEERLDNYTVMEGYELPSRGEIYNVPVNSHVELRSMTARDEMKRLAPSTTPLKTLADIIENCMIEKPAIHVYDMALGDYEYLLHKLRIVTYGPNYKMTLRCSECDEIIDAEADLDQLELREFDKAKFEELKTFTLPKSNRTVTIRFMTPRLLDTIELKAKEERRKHKDAAIDFDTQIKLLHCIEAVDGDIMPISNLESFINNLPAADMQKILNNIDRLNQCVGLKNELYITCPKCGEENLTFFRFGPEFFRPTTL